MNNNDLNNNPLNTNNGMNPQPMNQPTQQPQMNPQPMQQPQMNPQPMQQPMQQPQMNPQPMNQPMQPPQPQKKKPNIALIMIISFVILGILYFVLNIMRGAKSAMNTLDDARMNTFTDTAVEYCNLARNLNLTNGYVICDEKETEKDITYSDLQDEGGLSSVSAFGNQISEETFVHMEIGQTNEGTCTVNYSIYFSDGQYSIGTPSNPTKCKEITNSSVTKNK